MKDQNESIFINLFHEACQKCFGTPLTEPLSETDSKQLSNAINETTGLVIGVKSIKNYSLYVLNPTETKKENPSVATLDTMARYVLNAPETDELKRKKTEAHHPYWFQYRSRFPQVAGESEKPKKPGRLRFWISAILLLALFVFVTWFLLRDDSPKYFYDAFGFTSPEILYDKGWTLQKRTEPYWEKRNEKRDHLSLYTLIGDNWKDMNGKQPAGIKNLLVRRINADCFSVEIQLSGFIPVQSWQQAGILISEDSSFSGKALRLTIGYNDFFGGYTKPSEIIIQVVGSSVAGDLSRPEEIARISLFTGDPLKDSLIRNNLGKSALKIEKRGNQFRFLFTSGPIESFAFREAATGSFSIEPQFVGIFAMQGFAKDQHPMPVHFDSFSFIELECGE